MFDSSRSEDVDAVGVIDPAPALDDDVDWDALLTEEDWAWLLRNERSERVPEGIAALPPTVIGMVMSGVELGELSPDETVRAVQSHARAVAHHQAAMLEAMMAVADHYQALEGVADEMEAMEAAASEMRAALQLTRRAAETELEMAWRLRDGVPTVLEALRNGRICLRRARVLVDGTMHLPVDEARRVCERALERAATSTTGQLRALVRRLCVETDPDEATDRYQQAVEERRVTVTPEDDGTATLIGTGLAPERVTAAMNRIDRLARGLRVGGETRTIDQLRADVILDLLEGTGGHDARRGVVDIRIDLDTLLGLDRRAVELAGFGPVIDEIGRAVAVSGRRQWRYAVTDRAGDPVAVGHLKRRPTAAQRRIVELRDQTCVFPGCRMPATACDLDHRTPYSESGETDVDDLAPGCRHDHRIRHKVEWRYRRNPDGSHTWFSPMGMTYVRPPPD